jgi:hypothetical protein
MLRCISSVFTCRQILHCCVISTFQIFLFVVVGFAFGSNPDAEEMTISSATRSSSLWNQSRTGECIRGYGKTLYSSIRRKRSSLLTTCTFTLLPRRRYFDLSETPCGHLKGASFALRGIKWDRRRISDGVKYLSLSRYKTVMSCVCAYSKNDIFVWNK